MSGIRTSACSRSGGHIGSTAPLTAVPAVSGASVTGARGGAAAIAHDLQTPVAVILGLCARIEDGGLTAGQQADLTRVREQAQAVSQAARTMVDSARWVPSDWRLVLTCWAYVWVIAGMWFTISPWRLRDLITWATANEKRIRLLSGLRFGFGVFVLLLGLTVYRAAQP